MASFKKAGSFTSKADKLLGLGGGNGNKVEIEGQKCGFLYKKPVGRSSGIAGWKKRYFVLKDGFILWYGSKSNSPVFDTKPKGCMPLGGARLEKSKKDPRVFVVSQKDLGASATIYVRAEDKTEVDSWIHHILNSRKATWDNAMLGNALVEKMKAAGTALEQEKEDALKEFQLRAQELNQEKEQKEKVIQEREAMEKTHTKTIENNLKKLKELEEAKDELGEKLSEEEQARREVEAKRFSIERRLSDAQAALVKLETALTLKNTEVGKAFSDGDEINASVSVLRNFFEDRVQEEKLRARAIYERIM